MSRCQTFTLYPRVWDIRECYDLLHKYYRLTIILTSIAGVDTTSTTLAYLFWTLSRRPEIMHKLRTEIDEVMPDNRSIPDISVLFKLPYLAGFIKEGDSVLFTKFSFR